MATYEQLKAQAQALLEQAEQVRRQELAGVVEEIRATMAVYGITAKDLGFERKAAGARSRAAKVAGAAKYRGPDGQEWSGHGRRPGWVVQLLVEGKELKDYEIR